MTQTELSLHYNCSDEGDLFDVCKCGFQTESKEQFSLHLKTELLKLVDAARESLEERAQ